MVARLQPVAAWMALQLWPAFSMEAMPALRATSSTGPLPALGLRLGLPLGLPTATVVVILARDRGEHIKHAR